MDITRMMIIITPSLTRRVISRHPVIESALGGVH
jgi:hypothetical protein